MNALLPFPPAVTLLVVVILAVLATLRLTRLITTDTITEWLIRTPIRDAVRSHEIIHRRAIFNAYQEWERENPDRSAWPPGIQEWLEQRLEAAATDPDDEPLTWQGRLASALDCPWCIGFWIGAAITIITILVWPFTIASTVWAMLLVIFALNYIVGHVSARLD